jgi:hypothetical protein
MDDAHVHPPHDISLGSARYRVCTKSSVSECSTSRSWNTWSRSALDGGAYDWIAGSIPSVGGMESLRAIGSAEGNADGRHATVVGRGVRSAR